MNLQKKKEWDKDWIVLWFFFFFFIHFIPLNMYLHIFICTCMYMSMYEYPYFDYIVFYVHIEKEEKFTQKKKFFRKIKTS